MITSTQIGLRHIPMVKQTFDCITCSKGPVANLDSDDSRLILQRTYATTTSDYKNHNIVMPSASANRRPPLAMQVHYTQNVQDTMTKKTIGPPRKLLSSCHDTYQYPVKHESLGCEGCLSYRNSSWPKPGCDEETTLPPGPEGETRFLDPYLTTNRLYHRTFVPYIPGKTITFYSEVQEKKEKRPPDPTKNMCLGQGRPNVKINYDRIKRKKPIPLKCGLTTTMKSHFRDPVTVSQDTSVRLLDAGIRWNGSKFCPLMCKLH